MFLKFCRLICVPTQIVDVILMLIFSRGGRDSDEKLTILFKQWLTAVMEDKPSPPETECQASPTVPSPIKV